MSSRHNVLIVEDDAAAAEDLAEIVSSLNCESVVTDNHREAQQLLEQSAFCLVLLDLEIKAERDSIKGHTAHGKALLREIRNTLGGNRGVTFWTPVIIVSGQANEIDAAIAMVATEGADDVIRKPFFSLEDVVRRITGAIDSAGRKTHDHCEAATAGKPGKKTTRTLRITGVSYGPRAEVLINEVATRLTVSAMKILLRLAIAQRRGDMVHKSILGAKLDEGFKAISRLREQLRPALGQEDDIVANDHQGRYSLKPDVVIIGCDTAALKSLRDMEIDGLATELSALLFPAGKSDGG